MTSDPNVRALLDEMEHTRALQGAAVAEALPLQRVLGLFVARQLYGINIAGIREISKLLPITFVPGAAAHILGVTNLRGQILPVVNLRALLGLAPAAGEGDRDPQRGGDATVQPKPRVVVVQDADRVAGLLVEAVTEVYDLPVAPQGGPGLGGQAGPIRGGQAIIGDQVLILLQVPALFAQMEASQ